MAVLENSANTTSNEEDLVIHPQPHTLLMAMSCTKVKYCEYNSTYTVVRCSYERDATKMQ